MTDTDLRDQVKWALLMEQDHAHRDIRISRNYAGVLADIALAAAEPIIRARVIEELAQVPVIPDGWEFDSVMKVDGYYLAELYRDRADSRRVGRSDDPWDALLAACTAAREGEQG